MWWSELPGAMSAGPVPEAEMAALLDGAKEHLRVTVDDQDDYISTLIRAAVGHVESITGTPFCDREIELRTDDWSGFDHLPVGPVVEVLSIRFTPAGQSGTEDLDASGYSLRRRGLDAFVVVAPGQRWPGAAPGADIIATLKVGYGDNRPQELWQASLLLIGQWFRNRMAVNVGNIVNELPNGVDALLCNHRRFTTD